MTNSKAIIEKERVKKKGLSKVLSGIIIIVIVGAVVGGAVFFLTAQGQSASSGGNVSCKSQADSSAVQVSIYSGASSSSNAPGYTPDALHLVIGSNNTVTWTNNDAAAHTVTTKSAPSGASFSSGRMGQGATYTCTFTEPGSYEYYCQYHGWMSGTIVVASS